MKEQGGMTAYTGWTHLSNEVSSIDNLPSDVGVPAELCTKSRQGSQGNRKYTYKGVLWGE